MSDEQFDDDTFLAAEYALRLLEGDALQSVQVRLTQDQAFAQLVADWDTRLAQLADEVSPVTPPAVVKRKLEERLFPKPQKARIWNNLRVVQTFSALCVAGLLAFAVSEMRRPAPITGPLFAAEIVAQEGDFRAIAVVDKASGEIIITRTQGAAPDGRILQVWAHGVDEPAMSVGLWTEGDSLRLAMPPTIAAVTDRLTIGISEEPVGGSPTGQPTGRVLGTVDIPVPAKGQ